MTLFRKRFSRPDERGASAVEYGLLIAGIAALIVLAVFAIGGVTDGAFKETCVKFDEASQKTINC